MSDFGMFEADEATQRAPQANARVAARKMEAAIDVVRAKFGRFLLGATGIDEFGDRWHYSKADIRAAVQPYVFPNTGTMRRLQNAMKQDWKIAHPYKLAEDRDAPIQDLDETYHPSDANLIPEGDFEGYKDSVDQDGPEKVQNAFGSGGDTGSDKHARRRQAINDPRGRSQSREWALEQLDDPEAHGLSDEELSHRLKQEFDADPEYWNGKEAARLVADIYTDFARANGLRVASLDTLDAYATTGIHDADYRLLQSMIIATAAEDCECDDDEDSESDDSDSDSESEAPSASESDDSDSDDDSDEDYDFGGEDAAEGESEDDDDDEDAESDDSGASETESDDDDYGFGDTDDDGDHDDADHHDGGGEQFTVPEHAPELPPEMMQEIPQDDAGGSAPVPPEVIDSLLGLPEGTIEQLLLEEVEQGGGDPGMSGGPMPPEQGAPQGGGDDFFGEGGDDPEQEPPRVARRRTAIKWDEGINDKGELIMDGPKRYWPRIEENDRWDDEGKHYQVGPDGKRFSARSFWAAEDDESSSSDSSGGGGDSGGSGQQAAPAQDPAAMMGVDPNAMMGGGMMPPPGSQAVAPPTPPMPLENQPAEDALLDTANQAIMQMIDQETAEYQQIIDPLSKALQAIQFAQQVEQSEHPMDVTPPQGTVDVSPSAAPGGQAPQQPMQQMAMRRQAKVETALRNAAALIASRYRLSNTGHRMLVEAALGRRGYEHVVEALKLVPADFRKAAAIHMAHLFAAGNQRFNKDVFMKTVMASNPRDRAGDAWRDGRDRGIAEHGRHDMEDVGYLDLHPSPGKPRTLRDRLSDGADLDWVDGTDRTASRSRLPFELPRRTAGETWMHTPTMDAFEFPNAGEVPRIDDNNEFNNLPVMKGADPHGKNAASQKAVDRFQRWQTRQQQRGLPITDGEAAVHDFLQTSRPYKKRVGPDAQNMIHEHLGLQPDAVKTPKAKPVKAVNPALGKGTGKTPTAPKAKAPAPKAAPKTASFFTRKVPGWRWDDHLNGYLSKEARAFTCSCGQKVAAPSYKTCGCGKIWNVYAIGDTHHLASDTAEVFIAREIPVRDNVIMANRKLAGGLSQYHITTPSGTRIWHAESPEHAAEQHVSAFEGDPDEEILDIQRGGPSSHDDTPVPGKRMKQPSSRPKNREGNVAASAQKSHRELLAEIERLADWTKYDGPDPSRDPKAKPPSTKIPKQPQDWTNREFTGPDKGQWRDPDPTELPRKTRKKK